MTRNTTLCKLREQTSALFTGTAGVPPARSAVLPHLLLGASGAIDLAKGLSCAVWLALGARGGRAARGPSEEESHASLGYWSAVELFLVQG
jgi:hypothetical protein